MTHSERLHLSAYRAWRGLDAAADMPWHYSGDLLTVEYRTDPSRVAELLPDPLTLVPDDQDPGAVAMIFADWQSCGDDRSELLDPIRSQYKEAFLVVRCMYQEHHLQPLRVHLGRQRLRHGARPLPGLPQEAGQHLADPPRDTRQSRPPVLLPAVSSPARSATTIAASSTPT
jgi:hypothetical protein